MDSPLWGRLVVCELWLAEAHHWTLELGLGALLRTLQQLREPKLFMHKALFPQSSEDGYVSGRRIALAAIPGATRPERLKANLAHDVEIPYKWISRPHAVPAACIAELCYVSQPLVD